MLVIFGAGGRTGIEIVRLARRLGLPFRPVVRDDRDGRSLDKVVDVQEVRYADPDHPASLAPVLEGATEVISCINARTAGPGCPSYQKEAGAHIVRAAAQAGVQKVLHLSVVGAYRWSPNPLNRASFTLDREVRLLKDAPWTMMRVSVYFDEIIEGHVRPPDGRQPHPIESSTRYSPVSRRDVARMVLGYMPKLIPNRTLYVGGPAVYTGGQLRELVGPWLAPGSGGRTRYGQIPPGDVSVSPETTRIMVDLQPRDRLEAALDPRHFAPPAAEPAPVYARAEPGPHASDMGQTFPFLRDMGPDLRRVVHAQLCLDLERLGLGGAQPRLDWSAARPRAEGHRARVHEGQMVELDEVIARTADGDLLHRGSATFLYDELADEFFCWWLRPDGLPVAVWNDLDMGVRRRLATEPRWSADPRVSAFGKGPEKIRLSPAE